MTRQVIGNTEDTYLFLKPFLFFRQHEKLINGDTAILIDIKGGQTLINRSSIFTAAV